MLMTPVYKRSRIVFLKPILLYVSEVTNSLFRIKPKNVRKLKKLDDINSSLSTFEPSDKGLIFSYAVGKFSLRQPCRFSLFNEKVHQSLLTC